MPAPPHLPAALFHHSALGREEPWLFRAEGWDWRWHSWGEIARRVSAWAEQLSRLPAGSRTAFHFTSQPSAVALDLALQAAGLVSVPVNGAADGRGIVSWVEVGEEEVRPAPREVARSGEPSEGGVVVVRGGEAAEWTAGDVMGAASRLQEEIGTPSRKGSREVVVLSGPLERPEERAMMSWATAAGAAVVLEREPGLRVATAAWVRPTVFHGTAAELDGLRRWVEKEGQGFLRRGPGLPFRRLRTVLVAGDEGLAGGEEAFWQERGVRVGRLSSFQDRGQ